MRSSERARRFDATHRSEISRAIAIPVPPLPEQQRIVGILDEAFDGIATAKANAEKNLQNARALFESHLQCRLHPARRGVGGEDAWTMCRRLRLASTSRQRHERAERLSVLISITSRRGDDCRLTACSSLDMRFIDRRDQ